MESWREKSPQQALQAPDAIWARVRAIHAQWQLGEPGLKLAETANRLLVYGLAHVLDIERVIAIAREQEALEIHDDNIDQ